MATERTKNAHWCTAFVALTLLILVATFLKGSAVAHPPSYARQWVLTAGAVSLSVNLAQGTGGSGAVGPTQSILLCHDGTAGAPDIYFNLNSGTAAAPTNGGTNLTLKQGEKINYDGRYTLLSYISAGANTTLRAHATY